MHYTQPDVYEFISKQTGDPVVEWKTCTASGTKFPIFQSDLEFYKKISPIFDGQTFEISPPALCPEERQRRRLAWRNERRLYRRECDATQKNIVSLYKPRTAYKVYDQHYRWSDNWNALHYGRDIQAGVSVQDQFAQLMYDVPHCSLFSSNCENSEYTNYAFDSKDCYMVYGLTLSEQCYNGHFIIDCEYCCDSSSLFSCRACYEGINSTDCTQCQHLLNCNNCSLSHFIEYCSHCHHCIGCIGLTQQSYCIFNQQVSKEEWENMQQKLEDPDFLEDFLQKFHALQQQVPVPAMNMINTEFSCGDVLFDSKNCQFCFDTKNAENCKWISHDPNAILSYDVDYAAPKGTKMGYNLVSCLGTNFSIVAAKCRDSDHLIRCHECKDCHYCFGCIGLRDVRYCIFNKQYSKEDYEKEVIKLISSLQEEGKWGQFFDPSLSPFGYNETIAQEYHPIKKKEVTAMGYTRSDFEYHINLPKNAPVIEPQNMSYKSRQALRDDDSIVNKIILCEESGKPFRIVKQELELYRKFAISLPRKHPDIRHQLRLDKRPGKRLGLRKCSECDQEMLCVQYRESGLQILCESCYQQEVYG